MRDSDLSAGNSNKLLRENSIVQLPVTRVAKFGAFLDGGTGDTKDDILLHVNQQTRSVQIGDEVEVFLYHDPRGRLTASMHLPQIPVGQVGYVTVMLTTRFGAFVDVGTERGIFLPFSEMIGNVQKGQQIWVKLYEDKTGRLAVTMHVDEVMRKIALPCTHKRTGDFVEGTIYNITSEGAFIITRDRLLGFLYKDELAPDMRLGQEISGKITFIRPDGHFNFSRKAMGKEAIKNNGEIILEYMKTHQGILPLTDKSSPGAIRQILGMSKLAFKRAVGHLLKTGIIAGENDRYKLL